MRFNTQLIINSQNSSTLFFAHFTKRTLKIPGFYADFVFRDLCRDLSKALTIVGKER